MNDPQEEVRQVEPEILQELGELVVRWSLVEQYVSEIFILLTEGNRALMTVVTANVSQNAITGWIRTLLDIYDLPQDLTNEIKETLDEVDELRAERNSLVHGIWSTKSEPNSALVQTVRLERREIVRELVVTAADLRELVHRVLDVASALIDLFKRLPNSPDA